VGAVGELVDEPGLPDPGLAADQDDGGLTADGAAKGVLENMKLCLAPDQDRAYEAGGHLVIPVVANGRA
jgi:hypothetical protein